MALIKMDSWFKVSGPRVQTFCIDKDTHIDAI